MKPCTSQKLKLNVDWEIVGRLVRSQVTLEPDGKVREFYPEPIRYKIEMLLGKETIIPEVGSEALKTSIETSGDGDQRSLKEEAHDQILSIRVKDECEHGELRAGEPVAVSAVFASVGVGTCTSSGVGVAPKTFRSCGRKNTTEVGKVVYFSQMLIAKGDWCLA
ncbi:hypothetical protein Btru_019071, partial [Bulinus truncatus]